jgi:hypothetical protein
MLQEPVLEGAHPFRAAGPHAVVHHGQTCRSVVLRGEALVSFSQSMQVSAPDRWVRAIEGAVFLDGLGRKEAGVAAKSKQQRKSAGQSRQGGLVLLLDWKWAGAFGLHCRSHFQIGLRQAARRRATTVVHNISMRAA